MPRSNRDIFTDHVAALLRELGVRLESLSEPERRRLLQDARGRHLNDHEAALAVAYGHVPTLLDEDAERARILVDRLGLVGRQWLQDDLVRSALVDPLARRARSDLRGQGG